MVSVTVENSGEREGSEVVQLYVSDVRASVERPLRELKGFSKVFLKPGERKTVELPLGRMAFSFFDPNKKKWVAQPGAFDLLVGSSSRDIRLTKRFSGTTEGGGL